MLFQAWKIATLSACSVRERTHDCTQPKVTCLSGIIQFSRLLRVRVGATPPFYTPSFCYASVRSFFSACSTSGVASIINRQMADAGSISTSLKRRRSSSKGSSERKTVHRSASDVMPTLEPAIAVKAAGCLTPLRQHS